MVFRLTFGIDDKQKSHALKALERREEHLSSLSTAALMASNAFYINGSNNLGKYLFAAGGVALGSKLFQTLRRSAQGMSEGAKDVRIYPTRLALLGGAAAFSVGAVGVGTSLAMTGFTIAGLTAATLVGAAVVIGAVAAYSAITGRGTVKVTWDRFKKTK